MMALAHSLVPAWPWVPVGKMTCLPRAERRQQRRRVLGRRDRIKSPDMSSVGMSLTTGPADRTRQQWMPQRRRSQLVARFLPRSVASLGSMRL